MFLEDITLLAAMGPPGGGRTFITGRMVRHFNLLAYTEMDNAIISNIFKYLVNHFLKRFAEPI
jgi:dynein heavy chain